MNSTICCKFCGQTIKKGDGHHYEKCEGFKKFFEDHGHEILSLYVDSGYSVLELSHKYDIGYALVKRILKQLGTEIRGVKENGFSERRKENYKKTMLEKYGYEHNFLGGCESRKKWEERLLEEEGITNVFQRKEVKEKIQKTLSEKYDEDGQIYIRAKGNYLDYWIDKLGPNEGRKKYDEISFNKGKANRLSYYIEKYGEEGEIIFKNKIQNSIKKCYKGYHTSINERLNNLLTKYGFSFEREYVIRRTDDVTKHFSYDFFVAGKLIIEMNGAFWHADPKRYKKNDLLNFPGRKVVAKDIWEKDRIKIELAKKHGYNILVFWEDVFNTMTDYEIIKKIRNEISRN